MTDEGRAGKSGHDSMTLVSVRVPTADLEALRLAAQATGRSVAHLVRTGIQMQLAELRRDASFVDEVKLRRDALDRLVADLETPVNSGSRSAEPSLR